MTDHDDTLAGIDLHTWRIPPPLPFDRATLLVRALAPAAMPVRRRMGWLLAAIVLINAAIVAVVILLARAPATQVVVEPAGGGPVDARVGDLLQRLDQERRELELKLAEIEELRALIVELREKIRRYEQADRDRTVPKKIDRPSDRRPVDPYDSMDASADSCDEVSCVLSNYDGTCCVKFKKPRPPAKVAASSIPDSLDRASIAEGIAAVRGNVAACSNRSTAKGMVKVRVRVEPDGHVASVIVETTPDPMLGNCVARGVEKAMFQRTQHGGLFGYPFMF